MSAPGGIYEGDVTGTIRRGGALTFMDGCPLGKLMREALGVPVAVNNDGKCAPDGPRATIRASQQLAVAGDVAALCQLGERNVGGDDADEQREEIHGQRYEAERIGDGACR